MKEPCHDLDRIAQIFGFRRSRTSQLIQLSQRLVDIGAEKYYSRQPLLHPVPRIYKDHQQNRGAHKKEACLKRISNVRGEVLRLNGTHADEQRACRQGCIQNESEKRIQQEETIVLQKHQ